MSPPIPLSVLFHKCWLERLHDCCQHCGELDDLCHNDGDTTLDNMEITQEHTKTFVEHDTIERSSNTRNTLKSEWKPWESKNTQRKIVRKNSKDQSIVRLVYPKRLFKRIEKEAEVLLWQLPFQACFELVDDVIEDEESDEKEDMMADLIDAFKLHETKLDNEHEHIDDPIIS